MTTYTKRQVKNMSLTQLLIALDETNKTLDKIHNDPNYIQEKVSAIDWSDLTEAKDKALADINKLLETF